MKYLILSDTHLTDQIDESKYKFLVTQIKKADQVIILGDFWDGFFINFDQFINSPWRQLFPLLKQRKAVYLAGNHDPMEWLDERCDLFCDKHLDEYEFKIGQKKYFCTHGHQHVNHIDGLLPFVRNKYFAVISKLFYTLGTLVFKEKFWNHAAKQNHKLILYQKERLPKKILITGHTHLQQQVSGRYLNSGVCSYGLLQCAWIENNRITLVSSKN